MGSTPSKTTFQITQDRSKCKDRDHGVASTKGRLDFLSRELTNVCLEDRSSTKIKSKLDRALCWTSKHDTSWSLEFCNSINELFMEACDAMNRLVEVGNYAAADDIVKRILRFPVVWGTQVFEHLKIESFPRERIETKSAVILVGQYFKPEQFYKNDDRLHRLFSFEVRDAETGQYVFTYYFECSNVLQKLYVLCLSCSGGHLQLATYGKTCPAYWTVREDVLCDFINKEESALRDCNSTLELK